MLAQSFSTCGWSKAPDWVELLTHVVLTDHLIDYVADMCVAVDDLGWDRFSILGHSLGGTVGTFMAAVWPDRYVAPFASCHTPAVSLTAHVPRSVQRVVLVETLGPWATSVSKIPSQLAKSIAKRSHRPPRVHPTLEAAAVANSKGFLKTPLPATRVMVERGVRPARAGAGGKQGYVWRADPRLREVSRMPFTEEVVRAFIEAVTCPVLVITAADGLYAKRDPQEVARRLSWFSHLKHVELSAGSHHCHLIVPDKVAREAVSFLAA